MRSAAFPGELCDPAFQSAVDIALAGLAVRRNRGIDMHLAQDLQPGFALFDQSQAFAYDLARRAVAALSHNAINKGFTNILRLRFQNSGTKRSSGTFQSAAGSRELGQFGNQKTKERPEGRS